MFSYLYITYFDHMYPHPSPCLFLLSVFVNSGNVISVIYRRAVVYRSMDTFPASILLQKMTPCPHQPSVNYRSSGRGGTSETRSQSWWNVADRPNFVEKQCKSAKAACEFRITTATSCLGASIPHLPLPSFQSYIHSSPPSVGRGNLDEPRCVARH